MGINGLLPAFKGICRPSHISKYRGQKVAVDGYSWLHKGAYCCSRELCEGVWTDRFVVYFMSRVQLLTANGVAPLIVFDGGRLPIKGEEEEARRRGRREARARAAAHMAAGNTAAALECYQRAVDVTPAMARQVIDALKAAGVEFLVAPYEADAQMAYLARRGSVHAVVTEDSDLLAYACPRVAFKLDRSGACEEVLAEEFTAVPGLPLASFTHEMFLQMCILSGCDFLAGLQGIGVRKAHGYVRKYKGFVKLVKVLRFSGVPIPPGYEVAFQRALWAFRHCRVFCPAARTMVHLTPLPAGGIGAADVDVPAAVPAGDQERAPLEFLGPALPDEVARGIAAGELDPITHQPFDLQAIYAGCPNPPQHVAALLGLQEAAGAGAGSIGAQPGGAAARPRFGMSKKGAAGSSKGAAPAQKNGIARYLTAAGSGTAAAAQAAAGPSSQQRQQRLSVGLKAPGPIQRLWGRLTQGQGQGQLQGQAQAQAKQQREEAAAAAVVAAAGGAEAEEGRSPKRQRSAGADDSADGAPALEGLDDDDDGELGQQGTGSLPLASSLDGCSGSGLLAGSGSGFEAGPSGLAAPSFGDGGLSQGPGLSGGSSGQAGPPRLPLSSSGGLGDCLGGLSGGGAPWPVGLGCSGGGGISSGGGGGGCSQGGDGTSSGPASGPWFSQFACSGDGSGGGTQQQRPRGAATSALASLAFGGGGGGGGGARLSQGPQRTWLQRPAWQQRSGVDSGGSDELCGDSESGSEDSPPRLTVTAAGSYGGCGADGPAGSWSRGTGGAGGNGGGEGEEEVVSPPRGAAALLSGAARGRPPVAGLRRPRAAAAVAAAPSRPAWGPGSCAVLAGGGGGRGPGGGGLLGDSEGQGDEVDESESLGDGQLPLARAGGDGGASWPPAAAGDGSGSGCGASAPPRAPLPPRGRPADAAPAAPAAPAPPAADAGPNENLPAAGPIGDGGVGFGGMGHLKQYAELAAKTVDRLAGSYGLPPPEGELDRPALHDGGGNAFAAFSAGGGAGAGGRGDGGDVVGALPRGGGGALARAMRRERPEPGGGGARRQAAAPLGAATAPRGGGGGGGGGGAFEHFTCGGGLR